MAITDIHNKLLELLDKASIENPDIVFRLRKTNRSNRLEEGYWFLGNTEYLSVGFWKGSDWKRKVPNISFMVDYHGACWLHFSVSDDREKFDFILDKVFPSLGVEMREKDFLLRSSKHTFEFKSRGLKDCLSEFLTKYWSKIDSLIREEKSNNEDFGIGIIPKEEFIQDLSKVKDYKYKIELYERQLDSSRKLKIKSFEIENYGPIKSLKLDNIPINSQWIFLTGENGVGKSSVLKALARTIGVSKVSEKESVDVGSFECKIDTHLSNNVTGFNQFIKRKGNNQTKERKTLFLGFAAYGAMRLNPIHNNLSENQLQEARGKNGHSSTLFNNNAYLLDLETQYKEWFQSPNNEEFAKRSYAIKEFLEELLLNVGKVEFGFNDEGPFTEVQEIDEHQDLLEPVPIEKLSSGYMSIFAMMSDLLVRLYRQQPKVDDPGELKGLVFIDEIDIHLHPKFQKHLVEQLTKAFPKVQFIASTHSPIPLLGAPKSSVVCVVKRDKKKGTYLVRVDDKIYLEELLPNTILTSPIFGMDNISNESRDKGTFVRTEESFEELEFNDRLKNKIMAFLDDAKEKELIERFKNKRK